MSQGGDPDPGSIPLGSPLVRTRCVTTVNTDNCERPAHLYGHPVVGVFIIYSPPVIPRAMWFDRFITPFSWLRDVRKYFTRHVLVATVQFFRLSSFHQRLFIRRTVKNSHNSSIRLREVIARCRRVDGLPNFIHLCKRSRPRTHQGIGHLNSLSWPVGHRPYRYPMSVLYWY
jgi:hypothetical protein